MLYVIWAHEGETQTRRFMFRTLPALQGNSAFYRQGYDVVSTLTRVSWLNERPRTFVRWFDAYSGVPQYTPEETLPVYPRLCCRRPPVVAPVVQTDPKARSSFITVLPSMILSLVQRCVKPPCSVPIQQSPHILYKLFSRAERHQDDPHTWSQKGR